MNTNFGKIESEILIYAPSVLRVDDKQIISPNETDYLNSGYLPIVTGDDLEYKEGFEIVTSYKVVEETQTSDGNVIQKHILRVQEYQSVSEEPQNFSTLESRITDVENKTAMLTECILEMSELVYV